MAAHFSQTARVLASDSPRAAHIAWLVSGSLLVAWTAWSCLASVNVFQVSQRARLEVRQASHEIDALIAGQMATTSLSIGRDVVAGEVLVELDSARDRLRLAEERARMSGLEGRREALQREIFSLQQAKIEDVETALAAVNVAQAHVQEAQATIDFSRGAEQRVGQLLSVGAGAKVDALKAAAETQKAVASQKSWLAEAQRIEREARSKAFQNDAQIASLQHTLAGVEGDIGTSRSTIARLQTELEKYLLRAPISGRLADIGPSRAGSYVAEGQKLATILPPGDLIIVAEFPPSVALGRIQRGQQARMRLDGFPWAQYGTLSAAVTNVAGEIRDGLVRVELSVEGKPGEGMLLQHGLPGSLEVTVEEASPFRLLLRSAGVVLAGGPRPGSTQ